MRAYNPNGWGEFSQLNVAGQVVQTKPLAMDSLTLDPDLSTNTNIYLLWTTPTTGDDTGGDGGVSIIDY